MADQTVTIGAQLEAIAVPATHNATTWDVEHSAFDPQREVWCFCHHSAPYRVVRLTSGETVQVNVLYYKQGCCCCHPGLSQTDLQTVPAQLAENGLSQETWTEWVGKLHDVNSVNLPGFWDMCVLFVCMLLFPLMFLRGKCEQQQDRTWNSRFRKWQGDFNKVLEPFGIHVKSQSCCTVVDSESPEGDPIYSRSVERWLAFAMTPSSCAHLQSEPHMLGRTDNISSCLNPVDTNGRCMHP